MHYYQVNTKTYLHKSREIKKKEQPVTIDKRLKKLNETIIPVGPTDPSVTLYALAHTAVTVWVLYDIKTDKMAIKSDQIIVSKDETVMVTISGLPKDSACFYQIYWKESGKKNINKSEIRSFRTQRNEDSEFIFDIHADPHMDNNSNIDTYTNTIANTLADKPDFLIDIGDTSMAETLSLTFLLQLLQQTQPMHKRYHSHSFFYIHHSTSQLHF